MSKTISTTKELKDEKSSVLARCQRLLADHHALLKRHRYLWERLTTIEAKICLEPHQATPASRAALESQAKEQLDATSQRIKTLQSDKWLDKLFSIAENESQVSEIERLMDKWGQATYDSVAHCIVDHANRHRFPGKYLKYLRKVDNFNKKRSWKRNPEPGVFRWKKRSGEYLIERDGKIVSYGLK